MLEELDRLIRSAIEVGGGTEIKMESDAFFAVFPSATNALHAGVTAERSLFEHGWPEGAMVRVRRGLHTGEGVLGGNDYLGIGVNRAARVGAGGHGGQLLLSSSSRTAVGCEP